MNRTVLGAAAGLCFALASLAPAATSVWVSTTGSDSNAGTEAAPFLTITNGIAQVDTNGTVNVVAGEYVVNAVISVAKPVTIQGDGIGQTIVQTPQSNSDPVQVFSVSGSNVTLKGMTIKERKTSNTSVETAVVVGSTAGDFRLDGCRLEGMEYAIKTSGTNWAILNSQLAYVGPSNNNHRLIGIYGIGGTNSISGNTFDCSTVDPTNTPRTIFVQTDTGNYIGVLNITDNIQSNGFLRQFYNSATFTGSNYSLNICRNSFNALKGDIIFWGAPSLSIFRRIRMVGNVSSNTSGKGLLVLDYDTGSPTNAGTTSFAMKYNVLGIPAITDVEFAEATGSTGGLVGYNTNYFLDPNITIDTNLVWEVPGDFSTIQAAVNGAYPGDTISVASGTYTENVTISKSVVITGTSVVVDGDMTFDARPITLYGLTIATGRVCTVTSNGTIQTAINIAPTGGTVNVAAGLFAEQLSIGKPLSLQGAGATNTQLSHVPSPTTGAVISISAQGVTVSGFGIDGSDAAGSYGIENSGGSNAVIRNCILTDFACGLYFHDGAHNASILSNTVSSCAGDGVRFTLGSSNNVVRRCLVVGNGNSGVTNDATCGTLDAASNFWGAASGPGPVGRGTGDRVSANVTYFPWYTESAMTDLCVQVTVTGNPQSLTNSLGTPAVFTVTASGTAPLTYQWQKDGTDVGAATNPAYEITSVVAGDAGDYRCVISNMVNAVTSAVASLTVTAAPDTPPTITLDPQSLTVDAGAGASFSVGASGTAPLAYQWQKDGSDIAGATTTNYTIAAVVAGDAGRYRCRVTNTAGVATSAVATLTVNPPVPPSLDAPTNLTASDGTYWDKVAVNWDSVTGATSYLVYRNLSDDPSSAALVATAATTEYDDAAATNWPETPLYYWVKAANAQTTSIFSASAQGSCAANPTLRIPLSGDFDGDLKNDLALYQESSGIWSVKLSASGYAAASATLGGLGYQAISHDFDGDRKADPCVYEPVTGGWAGMLSGSGYLIATLVEFGGTNYVTAVGDYDGDLKADPAIYQASDGTWLVKMSASGYGTAGLAGFGGAGYTSMALDFDGDLRVDPAICQDATGDWTVKFSGSGYAEAGITGFGGPNYQLVPGMYDNDLRADAAIYNPTNGNWTVLLSASAYVTATLWDFGGAGFASVVGDFDGDGKVDPALYQESTSTWFVKLSASGYSMAWAQQ